MKNIQGEIGYFGLEDWWLSTFGPSEREHIERTYRPLALFSLDIKAQVDNLAPSPLTSGAIQCMNQTPVAMLGGLAGWFFEEGDRHIAYRMLEKAESLVEATTPVLDIHFLIGQQIKLHYKDREDAGRLERAIEYCVRQIDLAQRAAKAFKSRYKGEQLPSHTGYEQLAIIYEKRSMYQEAIRLCKRADKQGWSGTWKRRIDRCSKRAGLKQP